MIWSVEEQTIPTSAFAGDHHPHLMSIALRSDDSASHLVVLELHCEPDTSVDPPLLGYALQFNRNGALVAFKTILGPPADVLPQPEEAPASHHSRSKR